MRSEYYLRARCGKSARRDLCGGGRGTGRTYRDSLMKRLYCLLLLLGSSAYAADTDLPMVLSHCVIPVRTILSVDSVPSRIDEDTVKLLAVLQSGNVRLRRLSSGNEFELAIIKDNSKSDQWRLISSDYERKEAVLERWIPGPCP